MNETRTLNGYGLPFTRNGLYLSLGPLTDYGLWVLRLMDLLFVSNDGTLLVSVVDMGSPEYHGISVESDMSSIDTYGRQRVGKKGWGHLGNVTGLSIYIRYARSVTPRWNDSSCGTACQRCYARSATPRWNDSSCNEAHNARPSDVNKQCVTYVKKLYLRDL